MAAWWRNGVNFPYRSSIYFWTLQGVFAFMMINATVVFGPPVWKWVAVIVAILLVIVARLHKVSGARQDRPLVR